MKKSVTPNQLGKFCQLVGDLEIESNTFQDLLESGILPLVLNNEVNLNYLTRCSLHMDHLRRLLRLPPATPVITIPVRRYLPKVINVLTATDDAAGFKIIPHMNPEVATWFSRITTELAGFRKRKMRYEIVSFKPGTNLSDIDAILARHQRRSASDIEGVFFQGYLALRGRFWVEQDPDRTMYLFNLQERLEKSWYPVLVPAFGSGRCLLRYAEQGKNDGSIKEGYEILTVHK